VPTPWKRVALALGIVFGLTAGTARGDVFPTSPSDDTTTSLGKFVIHVNSHFRPAIQSIISGGGLPGFTYDSSKGLLTSPLLFDSATKIGKSAVLTAGSTADTNGVAVGTAGTMVSDSSFTKEPAGFEGSSPTREIHTELRTLDLTDSHGNSVQGGTLATDQPGSYGEVESKSNSGTPGNDFPAKSFFDVFVDIHMNLGSGTASLYNPSSAPLLVENDNLTSLPPKVLYTHDKSSLVTLLFRGDGPGGLWHDGDAFGKLLLAGHGVSYDINNRSDVQLFNSQFNAYANPTPEPSTLALMGLGGLALVACRRRARGNGVA
jgi:hypothetical protein